MAKRIGRPLTPDGKRKSLYLQVRIQGQERQAFKSAADLCGLEVSGWVRLRLREAAIKDLAAAGKKIAFISSPP